jgi:hypothetical protein
MANELANPARELRTLPESYTLQPSSEPSAIANVLPIPSGTLTASEWPCESPTITTRRGSVGGVVGTAEAAGGGGAAGATKAASSPPSARSNGSTAA